MPKLIGNWSKQTRDGWAAQYPASLVIRPDGQYRGTSDPPGEYTHWDVGTWLQRGEHEVDISTANDAIITYGFELAGDELTITDEDDRHIVYRAEKD